MYTYWVDLTLGRLTNYSSRVDRVSIGMSIEYCLRCWSRKLIEGINRHCTADVWSTHNSKMGYYMAKNLLIWKGYEECIPSSFLVQANKWKLEDVVIYGSSRSPCHGLKKEYYNNCVHRWICHEQKFSCFIFCAESYCSWTCFYNTNQTFPFFFHMKCEKF